MITGNIPPDVGDQYRTFRSRLWTGRTSARANGQPARWFFVKRRFRRASVATLLLGLSAMGTAWVDPVADGAVTSPAKVVTTAELQGLHFTDVTRSSGLAFPQSNQPLAEGNSMTGGVAACDLFGSGHIDLYVTRVGLPNELFRNNGNGTFTDVAAGAGVQGPDWKQGYAGATCGDLNGDGLPDLYVTSAGSTGNVLYLNNGNGTFSDATTGAGLDLPATKGSDPSFMYGSAIGDYNHDGRMDLITVQWDVATLLTRHGGGENASPGSGGAGGSAMSGGACDLQRARNAYAGPHVDLSRSRLYRNDGNGPDGSPHFTDVTASMGLDFSRVLGFTPTFIDLNGDGWDDLVIAGDACTSQVYLNDGGARFVDVTHTSGAGTAENGMGSAFGDFNGDGRPDWFETSIYYPRNCPTAHSFWGCSGNRMYLNRGNGKFRDATDRYGVRIGGWGWGAAAEDYNNSGRISVAQVDGMLWAPNQLVHVRVNRAYRYYLYFYRGSPFLWLNDGSKPFPQVAQRVGLRARGEEKAVVPIDLMNDGRLGLFITNTGRDPVLYRNDSVNHNGWLTVRLRDNLTGDRFGVGAKVVVQTAVGGRTQESEVLDSGSYESSNPLELHFGLGPDITVVNQIEVFWPGQTAPQVIQHVPSDQILVITRS